MRQHWKTFHFTSASASSSSSAAASASASSSSLLSESSSSSFISAAILSTSRCNALNFFFSSLKRNSSSSVLQTNEIMTAEKVDRATCVRRLRTLQENYYLTSSPMFPVQNYEHAVRESLPLCMPFIYLLQCQLILLHWIANILSFLSSSLLFILKPI